MKIKLIQQSNLFKSLKVIEDTVRDDLINFSYQINFKLDTYSIFKIFWEVIQKDKILIYLASPKEDSTV